jgi:hypothetical protein
MSQSKNDCEAVFRGFIKQYYHVLHKMPQMRAKFYKDNSSWTMRDGDIEVNAQGLDAIRRAFAACPLNGARVDFGYEHAQMTFNEIFNVDENGKRATEGIFILVYGSMELKSDGGRPRERLFQQAFMLTRKERDGNVMYLCRNDAFAFVGDVTHAVASVSDDQAAVASAASLDASAAAPNSDAKTAGKPATAAPQQSKSTTAPAAAPKQPKQVVTPKQETAKKKPKTATKQGDNAAKKGDNAAKGTSGKSNNNASNKASNRGNKQQQHPRRRQRRKPGLRWPRQPRSPGSRAT